MRNKELRDKNFLNTRELSEQYNWPFGGIQGLLFNRHKNGLNRATIKIGRKLLIDRHKFENWLKEHYENEEIDFVKSDVRSTD